MKSRRGEAGQVLPLVAICLAVLMGFGALAVDVGYLQYQERAQQSATDAAAIAGARQLVYDGCPSPTTALTAARTDASTNGYTHGSGSITVNASNAPASGPFSGDSCAVQVTIYSPHATFLAKAFGHALIGDETTQAVATLKANANGCIYLLSSTDNSTFNGDTLNAASCGLLINGTGSGGRTTYNGAQITAGSIGYVPSPAPIENGSTFSRAVPAPMLPVVDPCMEIAGCAYLTNHPPSTSACSSVVINGTPGTLNPGCYSSLTVNGTTATFNPGVYVFTGNTILNGATLIGSGVTIYAANGSSPTFNGVSSGSSLTPPTTGNYANVLYFQPASNHNNPTINGTNLSFTGLVYAPGATNAIVNGSSGGYMVLVFGAATFNGSANFAGPPANGSLIREAVLAE